MYLMQVLINYTYNAVFYFSHYSQVWISWTVYITICMHTMIQALSLSLSLSCIYKFAHIAVPSDVDLASRTWVEMGISREKESVDG